jgi:hypothetical protein
MFKLFLDDIRNAPDESWIIVRDARILFRLLKNIPDHINVLISLDHDMGDDNCTGYEFLNWVEKRVVINCWRPNLKFEIHSANPVGRANMKQAIKSIEKYIGENNV